MIGPTAGKLLDVSEPEGVRLIELEIAEFVNRDCHDCPDLGLWRYDLIVEPAKGCSRKSAYDALLLIDEALEWLSPDSVASLIEVGLLVPLSLHRYAVRWLMRYGHWMKSDQSDMTPTQRFAEWLRSTPERKIRLVHEYISDNGELEILPWELHSFGSQSLQKRVGQMLLRLNDARDSDSPFKIARTVSLEDTCLRVRKWLWREDSEPRFLDKLDRYLHLPLGEPCYFEFPEEIPVDPWSPFSKWALYCDAHYLASHAPDHPQFVVPINLFAQLWTAACSTENPPIAIERSDWLRITREKSCTEKQSQLFRVIPLPKIRTIVFGWLTGALKLLDQFANRQSVLSQSSELGPETSIIESPKEKPSPEVASQRVQLFGYHRLPLVDGKEVQRLTTSQYDVVQALIESGGNGLTKDELDDKSGHTDARKLLSALQKIPEWATVIQFPGRARNGGYRIL